MAVNKLLLIGNEQKHFAAVKAFFSDSQKAVKKTKGDFWSLADRYAFIFRVSLLVLAVISTLPGVQVPLALIGALLVISSVYAIFSLWLNCFVINLLVRMVTGKDKPLAAQRAFVTSKIPAIFEAVPLLGIVMNIWGILLLQQGIRFHYKIDNKQAWTVIALLFAIAVALAALLFFVIPEQAITSANNSTGLFA